MSDNADADRHSPLVAGAECLLDAATIRAATAALGASISADYAELQEPLVVLLVMNGAVVFGGDLLPALALDVELDYVHASRYRDDQATDALTWQRPPPESVSGREVLLVDDILDAGVTLAAVAERCYQLGAVKVRSAVLLHKHTPTPAVIAADYVAFEIADRYVYGWGMDYRGRLRNAPGIFALPC
ncbi:hypoxanthine-guanine phosphoribosyltransferase [Gilvimarinus polysaccharolyticus]|uniref:hypoxanthine-guanine phosphoribosyltransferase n=1 Tax=Gilvimarinus polysaccharolyticus TaxID=863921 RepID=UPI000673529F|nr:hypoxanthine-guanine phosphoribosyltransferase [Gilvimarinus polysaccharolyticus]